MSRGSAALGRPLASALLAGEWTQDAMLQRAREVLIHPPRRLPELVRDVRSAYAEPPLDNRRNV